MNLVKNIEESILGDIEYYENKINLIKDRSKFVKEVGEKLSLEDDLSDPNEVIYYGSTFKFTSSSYEDAFRITGRLLELFPEIERFSKEFDGSMNMPVWRWVGGITKSNNVTILFVVDKASPAEDCLPRQEAHSYKTWVCGKEEVSK